MNDFYQYLSAMRTARSQTQLNLGGMIDLLEKMPKGSRVANIGCAHSYRGYYSDLAFQRKSAGTRKASSLLRECRNLLGKKLEGYKGGLFEMGHDAPVWIAGYGSCGDRLMSFTPTGDIVTSPDDWQ